VFLGPDTDTLVGGRFRFDDCHFSTEGQMEAAGRWFSSIKD